MATNEQIQIIIKAMASQAISELEKVNKGLSETEKQGKRTTTTLADLNTAWVAAAGAAGVLYTAYRLLIKPASDLEEQTSKFNVVFRESSEIANRNADVLVRSYSLSTRAAREYMSTLGDVMINSGMSSGAAAELSANIIKLSADMSSFKNIGIEEIFAAFRSGMAGESEPLRRLGIVFNEASFKAKALAMGIREVNGQFTMAQRATVLYQMALEQQSFAVGDLARTQNSFANTLRRTQAEIEDTGAKLGAILLPAITNVINALGEQGRGRTFSGALYVIIQAFAAWIDILAKVIRYSSWFADLLGWVGEKLGIISREARGVSAEVRAMWQAFQQGNIAAQAINPILQAVSRRPVRGGAAPTVRGGGGASQAQQEADQRFKIENDYHMKILELEGNRMAALQQRYTDELSRAKAVGANLTDIHRFYALERDRLEQEMFQQQMQRYQEAASIIGQMWGSVGNVAGQYFRNQSISLDNWYKKQKAAITNSTKDEETKKKELEALDEQYAKKQREMAIKQAKYEKANAIITAMINTAMAVTSALARSGPPWVGITMASIVGAMGAAQVALIAKQPIPEAAEGAFITGSQAGTLIRAGEGGRSEAVLPLDNPQAMDKLGGLGGVTVNLHFDKMWAASSMPQEVANAVDKALYDLRRRGNSRFASAIEG